MVNAKLAGGKLPSWLVDSSATKKKSWNALMRTRYRFERFKKKEPDKYNALRSKLLSDLTELDKAVNNS